MIKKFHAQNTRDALRQVRDALGANAIILSNRQIAGGVEIIAVADLDMARLTSQAEPALWEAARQQETARIKPAAKTAPAAAPANGGNAHTTLADYIALREAGLARPATDTPAPHVTPLSPPAPMVDELAREIRLLRSMVEGQLAGFAWNDLSRRGPVPTEAMKRLLAAGFSARLSRQLLDRMPGDLGDIQAALKWLKTTIAHNIRIARHEDDIIEKGGVFALVGPTGVGKTTTVAKIAARAVLRHGASKVALVTTDTYRIGAQDQLRIYGRILGTPVFAVRDENDLELTLADLSARHLVLVDTVGMSQRDKRLAEQIALLCGEGRQVNRLLLLGAPSQGVTLEEVARAYAGPGLLGCALTKIDEALTFGPVLDVAIRHELPVHFVTNGQRVPEDLHLANAAYLADRAFRASQNESPFTQQDGDYPLLMAAGQEPLPFEVQNGDALSALG